MTKSLLERLDDSVRWTRIPALAESGVRRRHHRWLPIAALALSTGGLLLSLQRPSLFWVGWGLLIAGMSIGNFLPSFGPLVPPLSSESVDERQRSQRRDAYLFAFVAIGIVAVLGLFALAGAAAVRDWSRDLLLREMVALTLYLLALFTTLPTLHASWKTRPIPDD
jgi:MFS family permease